jgi:hypothetical protein
LRRSTEDFNSATSFRTTGQRRLGFLDLELARAQRGFAFRDRTFPRDERVEPLLSLRLASCE